MAAQPPPPLALSWAWVVGALASFKEVDIPTLIDVFKSSPDISKNVGSNAREMASFRTLERLFDPETQPTNSGLSAPNSGVSFDFSERCEDVLQRILREMHRPNTWDEAEKSKWDVQPFIEYKRSCLVNCDLQQLKDTIIKGRLSHLTSLKQRGTFMHLNQSGTRIHDANGAVSSNQQQGPCNDNKVCQVTSKEGNEKGECFDDFTLQGDRNEETRPVNGEAGDDVEHSSNGDWYHKQMNDIAAKKRAFLSLKCRPREVATHQKEENHCMKCYEGGQLFTCSSDDCSFVFHDSCLVSTSTDDNGSTGKFYCPFCRYSRSISDYWMAKRKVSLARNDLVSFSSSTLKHRPKRPPKRLCVSGQNSPGQDKVVNGSQRADGFSNLAVPDSPDENSESSGLEGHSEGGLEKRDYGVHSIRFPEQVKRCTYFHVPQIRRIPVPWTQLEEKTLEKGVQEFLGARRSMHDRGIPWRKILEAGASVFHTSRTPGDLKDKWRNMQKASITPE